MKLTHHDCPDWLRDALRCPVCERACILTTSGGMVCWYVPAHTGGIQKAQMEVKVKAAYALAKARDVVKHTEAQVMTLARKWLTAQPLPKTAPREKENGDHRDDSGATRSD